MFSSIYMKMDTEYYAIQYVMFLMFDGPKEVGNGRADFMGAIEFSVVCFTCTYISNC